MRRNRTRGEGWTAYRRCRENHLQAVLYAGARERTPATIWKHRSMCRPADSAQPIMQLRRGAFPERDDSFLAAFAMQVHGGCAIQEEVGHTQAGDLGHPCARVVQHSEEDRIAVPASCGAVRSVKQGLDLFPGQEAHDRMVDPLGHDGEHALRQRQ